MTLQEFFVDKHITIPFKLFGKTHIFLILIIILGALLIYHNRYKINKLNSQTKTKITKYIALILLLNILILYISSIYYKCFNFKTMLPLHPCYIANYFYIYAILFHKEKLYKYIYFLSFIGPIPAIIFFDVPSVFESYNFYLYIISHHFLLLGTIFTFYMYPKIIKIKDLIKLGITLNILSIFISKFNHIFHTNYFFTNGIPSFILNIVPFIKKIPTIITLEIMGIIILILLYKFWNKETKKLKNTSKIV